MKWAKTTYRAFGGLLVIILVSTLPLLSVFGQWPAGPPTTPHAQRNALGAVRSQVGWVQNATKVASNDGNLWQTFQALRQSYYDLKSTLTPKQLAHGANQFAELDAGLDIIQEAFGYYQEDLAAGRAAGPALRNLCRVVRESTALWLQELNKTCTHLQVGWGG
jgi:hypothetical protein